ncbi:MAG: tRNA pseudouridine(13) synthase TruD [Candidatus Thermoplasmatota archaeon]|nr:tRNA pseudouridine(13) synthase TruD [Candidatus Thermoplasmatota archaeon]
MIDLGIETYLTETEGIGGIIKEEPEDFVVKEAPISLPSGNTYCVFWMKARNWETNALLSLITRKLRIDRNRIHIAGTKDKRAISEQLIVIKAKREDVERLHIDGVELRYLYSTDRKLYLGNLYGNEFFVRVRHCNPENVPLIIKEIEEKGGFPNFFGVQRFGISRPNTHRIGERIVEGDFEGAVLTYICEPGGYDSEELRLAKKLAMEKRFEEALEIFPWNLEFERILLRALAKKEDYVNAIKTLPINLRTMFVYAYQSYLFNRILSERIRRKLINRVLMYDVIKPIKESLNPEDEDIPVTERNMQKVERNFRKGRCSPTGAVPGYDSVLPRGIEGDIESKVLNNINMERFWIYRMPELSAKGLRRALQIKTKISYNVEDDSAVSFSFYLPKGTYATSLLREIMKSEDMRAYG